MQDDDVSADGGGHARLVEELTRTLAGAVRTGAGSCLIVLTGPAGSGKSTLAAGVVAGFDREVPVAAVRPPGDRRTEAFWLVDSLLGTPAERRGGGADPAPEAPDPAGRLVEEVRRRTRSGPLLLVVDDAHRLDEASVQVLRRVARVLRDRPVGLLIASRPSDRPALRALVGDAAVHVRVPPLSPAEVSALVQVRTGGAPGPTLRGELDVAGGNPLFVHELLDQLQAEGALDTADGRAELSSAPPGTSVVATRATTSLEAVVLAHLERLGPRVHDVVVALAVLGGPASITVVAAVTGLPARVLSSAVRDGIHGGALVWRPGDQLDVRHDAFREVAHADLSPAVARAEHRRVAEVLARVGADAAEVDRQTELGAVPGDPQAVAALRRKAESTTRFAPAVAAELFAEAVSLAEAIPSHTDGAGGTGFAAGKPQELRAGDGLSDPDELVVAEVGALLLSGQPLAGERRALDWLRRSPPAATRAALTTLLIRCQVDRAAVGPALTSIDTTLAVPRLPAQTRQDLLGLRSWVQVLAGDLCGARAALERLGPRPSTGVDSASTAAACLAWLEDRPVEALRVLRDPVPDLTDTGPLEGRMTPLVWRPTFLLDVEGPDSARHAVDRARSVASERGAEWLMAFLLFVSGSVAIAGGDWERGRDDLERGLLLADERGTGWVSRACGGLAVLYARRGEFDAARAAIARGGTPDVVVHFGLDEVGRARLALAEATGDAATPSLARALWAGAPARGQLWCLTVAPDVLRVAAAAGDDELGREVATYLGTQAATAEAGLRTGPIVSWAQAVASHDPARMADVVARLSRAGFHTLAAQATEELAFVTLAAGDGRSARRAVAQADTAYAQLGARADVERLGARARAVGLGLARQAATSGWEALTPGETRVVTLLGEGLTNPQIAARLHLSPRTVQTHVRHAMDKLGMRSRVEIARAIAVRP